MSKKFWGVTDQLGNQVPPVEFPVASGTAASISEGMAVVVSSNNMAECSNGATSFGGIAAGPSDETATAAGTVLVYRAPTLKFHAYATTPGNLSSSTLLTKVTLDVSGTDHTIDENDTSSGFIEIEDQIDTTTGECVCVAATTL